MPVLKGKMPWGPGNIAKVGKVISKVPGFKIFTQPQYEGTKVPKPFELVADGEKFWVHPNGTKHMVEYITRDATMACQ